MADHVAASTAINFQLGQIFVAHELFPEFKAAIMA
jgi:hypothetical protein